MRGTWRRYVLAALPFAAAVAGAFILGEIYVRTFLDYVVPVPWQAERSLTYAPAVFARHIFPAEEQTKSEIPGIVYHINSLGYRGEEFSFEKPAGTLRIIFYGGSSVFDPWCTEGEDWPRRVGDHLRAAGFSNVETINAGIPGHATFDAVGRLLTEGHLLRPDYVVLSDTWNDLKYFRQEEPILRTLKPIGDGSDPRLRYNNWLDRLLGNYSQLYTRLRQQYYDWKYNIGPEGQMPEWEPTTAFGDMGPSQYRLDVETFVDLARNAGSEPVLMIEPRLATADSTEAERARIYYHYVGLTHDGLVAAYERAEAILREVAAEKQVMLIDSSAALHGRDEFFVDHVHLNKEGAEELSRLVAQAFTNRLGRTMARN
mgnify:CR=1 FL=1